MQVTKSHYHIDALSSEWLEIVGFNGYYPMFMLDVFKEIQGSLLSFLRAQQIHHTENQRPMY